MAVKPFVTFIICTYNRRAYLDDSIKSILQNNLADLNIELLIVDNNSSDETKKVVQKYKQTNGDYFIRYVKEKKQGLSHARNSGIKEARGDFIVFLDDDIRASAKLISAWVLFFKNHPEAAAAGGRIKVQFDDPRPPWMSRFLLPLLGYHNLGKTQKKYPRNKYPFGGNMGFNKSIFEQYGLFETELGRKGKQLKASEEKEFFQRLKNGGAEIFYLPEALLFHRVNKRRLTPAYIKKQAVGLGQSLALQFKDETIFKKLWQGLQQGFKTVVSFGLFLPYAFTLQYSKGVMLLKFRKWIAEGYFSINDH